MKISWHRKNILDDKYVFDKYYGYAKQVWAELEIKTISDFHDRYSKPSF